MEHLKHILGLALLCFIISSTTFSQSISDTLEQKILSAQAEGRIVDNLNNSFSQQPKGEFLLAPKTNDLKFGVIIYNIDIYPDKAVFSAGIAFRDPKSNQLIAFRSDNNSFSNTNGLAGPVKLYLVKDVSMMMGQAVEIILQAGIKETYAVFDCKGLKEFGMSGMVNFNSDFILPVNGNGEIMPEKTLSTSFKIKAESWSDMVVQIGLQPFQIRGLKNYIFTISNATMDLSENMNADNMKFPPVYKTSEILGNQPNSWEGFYLEKGSVTFPDHFKSNTKKKIELGVTDLLIDEFGFSGTIFGNNLIDFEKGRIANWHFSINNAEIELAMNEIVSGKLSGDLGMPVLPDTSKLGYVAYVGVNDNYGMQVNIGNNLSIPAFKVARVELTKNSYVDMTITEGHLTLTAELNGEFLIANKSTNPGDGPKFNFPSVAFQGFKVSNESPKIDIDYLGLKNTNKTPDFSKYPLNINEIYLQKSGTEKRIGIRFGLNLMEKLTVKAGISIIAEENADKLNFKRLDINEIEVRSVTSCFTLEGKIYFIKEDPDYGNGFSGSIKFTIDKPKIEAAASVLFGNIKSHRYWYFDASVMWDKPGIPFFTGAEFNGFLGGAWHGMREVNEKDNVKNLQYGLTSIGKHYVPDVKAGLGLRAGVYIRSTGGTGSSSPFLAKVALEIQFNTSNGINKISLFGNIDVMTENNKTEKTDLKQSTSNIPNGNAWKTYQANYKPLGKIGGPFMLEFDFANKVYQANFAIYLQGIADNKIVGIGEKGLAGEVSIYFSSSKWYFWVGTPKQPIGIKLNLGSVGYATVSAYFMAGKDVQPAEPLPKEITNILGEKDAGEMRKLSDMATGNAFAFGSRLFIQIGSLGSESNVSIYASLKAIIGFDINVANYGKNNNCSGHTGPPGINGWYANGQLFTYLQGNVGASYKLGKLNGTVDLLTLTCAAQLYCQGPNPFYSSGSAAIQVNIAGVYNKTMSLNFEIGEACEMKRKSFTDTVLILETSPGNGNGNISTLAPIETRFSVPVESPFTDIEGKQIIFKLLKYDVLENSRPIAGKISWNKDKTSLSFVPENLLPGNSKIKISIQVEAQMQNTSFDIKNINGTKPLISKNDKTSDKIKYMAAIEKMMQGNLKEMDYGNGMKLIRNDRYEAIMLNGKKVDEIKEVYFYTSANPPIIPDNNIVFSYPVKNQLNYYKSISDNGYIQLKTGQDYLTKVPGSKIMALFVDESGKIISESRVNVQGKKLQYHMPNNILKTNEVYQLVFKSINSNSPTEVGHTYSEQVNKLSGLTSKNSTVANTGYGTTSGIESTATKRNESTEQIILTYYFSTSKYTSLADKISALGIKENHITKETALEMKITNKDKEYFDFAELKNKENTRPLLEAEMKLNQMPLYAIEAKKIYSIFTCKDIVISGIINLNRDTLITGLIPFRTISLSENNIETMFLQTKKQGAAANKPDYAGDELVIENNYYEIISNDLTEIKNGLIQYVSANGKLNTGELNKYFNLWNIRQTGSEAKGDNTLEKAITHNLSTTSYPLSVSTLTGSNIILNGTKENVSIPRNGNVQQNEWLLKIASIKIQPLNASNEYALAFLYYLPGESKPVFSCTFKTVKSK